MKIFAFVLAAAVAAAELQAPVPQARTAEFLLAVLRRDGIVAPFAAFDGRRWTSRWPNDIRSRELPISLEDVPEHWWGMDAPPGPLTIWRDGARAGTVNLTGVATARLMCEPRVALKSDYKSPTPPPPAFELPYPKDGLLVSGDVPVERIESLENGSAPWNQVLMLLTDQFNRHETAAAGAFTSWQHPVKADQRKLVPIAIEALYRAPTREQNWTAYYVEAVRQYPPGRDDKDGCGLATFGHGWVLVGPNNDARVRISTEVTYCDRKGARYMLPFGIIRANDHVYWIYQFSGFEEEWYEVAEPTRGGIDSHVAFRAGACRR